MMSETTNELCRALWPSAHKGMSPGFRRARHPTVRRCVQLRELQIVIRFIAECNKMMAAEKLRYLRLVEGHLRGLNREMTQKEVVGAIKSEMKRSISQPYLSQLESGRRKHLTNTSRLLLAKFFRVHPGYLVDDPEGYQTKLMTDLRLIDDQLDQWLIEGTERFRKDPGLAQVLLKLARRSDSRKCIRLLAALLDRPELVDRLWEILQPNEG